MEAAVDQEMPSNTSTVFTVLKTGSSPPTAAAASGSENLEACIQTQAHDRTLMGDVHTIEGRPEHADGHAAPSRGQRCGRGPGSAVKSLHRAQDSAAAIQTTDGCGSHAVRGEISRPRCVASGACTHSRPHAPYSVIPSTPTARSLRAVGMDAASDQEEPLKASTVLTGSKPPSAPPTAAAATHQAVGCCRPSRDCSRVYTGSQ